MSIDYFKYLIFTLETFRCKKTVQSRRNVPVKKITFYSRLTANKRNDFQDTLFTLKLFVRQFCKVQFQ